MTNLKIGLLTTIGGSIFATGTLTPAIISIANQTQQKQTEETDEEFLKRELNILVGKTTTVEKEEIWKTKDGLYLYIWLEESHQLDFNQSYLLTETSKITYYNRLDLRKYRFDDEFGLSDYTIFFNRHAIDITNNLLFYIIGD